MFTSQTRNSYNNSCDNNNDDDDDGDEFDIVNINQELDLLDIITDFDDATFENGPSSSERKQPYSEAEWSLQKSYGLNENDGVSKRFNEIAQKPMQYWLYKN